MTLTISGDDFTTADPWVSATVTIIDNDDETPEVAELPEVSVLAYDSTSAEAGPSAPPTSSGTFVLIREGPTESALSLNYHMYGLAEEGVDYTTIGTVTIPAGAIWTSVIVQPIDDPDWEGDETVVFELQQGIGYTVGNSEDQNLLKDDGKLNEPNNGWQDRVKVDLDVNNNLSITDLADGADKYLPGYERQVGGEIPKVSIGTTFNAPNYQGQRMNIVVDGAGTNEGITKVEFAITNQTSYDGFAVNGTATAVVGFNSQDDYSFLKTINKTTFTALNVPDDNGRILADKAFAAFWAKDYGGYCNVDVTVWKGTESVTKSLKIPLDTDNDQIADRWERDTFSEWKSQYIGSVPAELGWQRTEDLEDKDPDKNGPLFEQASLGDHIRIAEEYRGFILDTGGRDQDLNGNHLGGHKRLSGARKEALLEVDHDSPIINPPDVVRPSDLSRMVTLASAIWAKAGIRMYGIINESSLPAPTIGPWLSNHSQETAEGNQTAFLRQTRFTSPPDLQLRDAFRRYISHMVVFRGATLWYPTPLGWYHPGLAQGWTFAKQNTQPPVAPSNMGSFVHMQSLVKSARFINVTIFRGGAFVLAHELMHIMINPPNASPWDINEHLLADATNSEIMYQDPQGRNVSIERVVIGEVTQRLIDLRGNPSLYPLP